MEINVNDSSKLVEVWLNNEEKNNSVLRAELAPIYSEYKARKYLVAVFESGSGDLAGGMQGLIYRNRALK